MSQDAQLDYGKLVTRFRMARHAWKRAAMLSGAVVVVIEGIGTLTLATLADVLFSPSLPGRVAILVGAAGVVGFFTVRHVFKPLVRRITNKQLALYLEERNPQFEGALIAAAEFGPDDSFHGRQAQIIESILQEAVKRAEKLDVRKAVDLTRFRKYGMVAGTLVVVYVAAGVLMPATVGSRFARLMTPWRPTTEEIIAAAKTQPVRFALSQGDGEILRGSVFELEAVLSRQPAEEVVFHFRSLTDPSASSTFKTLSMKELEKLNTYQGTLPDVNEGFEFFVSSGSFKSETHKVAVYDPLVVKSIEITTSFPSYMKFADRIEKSDQADVSAPIGSTVAVRFITNRPVLSGDVLWEKGNPLHGTIDAQHKETLAVSFPVKDTTTFQYTIKDAAGQIFTSRNSAKVTAVVDQPPTIKMVKPGPSFSGNPLSEIAFLADVADDFGLDVGELVVSRTLDGAVKEERFPLSFESDPKQDAVTATKANATLALESLTPKVMPGEVLVCHMEVRDRKGQPAFSDLTVVDVTPFESWAYFIEENMQPHAHEHFLIEPVISATWRLQSSKNELAPRDFLKQGDEIAATMVDAASGEIVPYFSRLHKTPVQIMHGEKAMKLAQNAHDNLTKHDTNGALVNLQLALAELKLSGYTEMVVMHQPITEPPAAEQAKFQEEMKRMAALMQQAAPKTSENAAKDAHAELDAAAQAAKAEELKKAQAQVVDQLKQAAAQQQAEGAKAMKATADKQTEIAKQTEALAQTVRQSAHDDEKAQAAGELSAAAQNMTEAAAQMQAANASDALAKAQTALQQLTSASDKLNANSQDRINQLLAQAAAMAQELHRKQEDLLKQTKADPTAADIKALSEGQVQLTTSVGQLNEKLANLQKIAAVGALKLETSKHVDEAVLEIKRAHLQQQMTDAAVELASNSTTSAVPHQNKALAALAHVKDELVVADNARATDLTTALAQAKAQAQALNDKLTQLAAKPETQPADQAQTKPGQAQAKADEQPKTGEQPATQAKAAPKLSPQQRQELAAKAADDAARLARQLASRDFAKNDQAFAHDIQTLQQMAQDPAKMTQDLAKTSPPKDIAGLAGRLSDKLESAYDADLAAKKLFAAQREECPPQYRPFVNAYFEALSKQAK